MFGVIVRAANADVKETIGIGVNTKDASSRLSILWAGPLSLELDSSVEQLKARILPQKK